MKSIVKTVAAIFLMNCFVSVVAVAQTNLVLSGNNLVMSSDYLVLNNTTFTNNSTFQPGSGSVIITGDAADANAKIDGTSQTTFYNLEINKSSNNALLGSNIEVSNVLTLSSGHLDLDAYNLTITNTGAISNNGSSAFVKTSSTGTLIQEVSNSNVLFPIGNQSYTPITLNNAGTTDDFNARIENTVYQDGTSGNAITTDVIDATWYVDEATAGGSDITATFQWNASDELTDFDRTQAFVSIYHTSIWNNGIATAASGSDPYTLTESGISTFAPFIVASDAAALPVELLYFYGEKEGENVLLSWETATEINNDYFDVEYSLDGVTFEKIGQIKGAGTTTENQSYEFLHTNTKNGLNYYRLKQVDLPVGQAGFDERYEYTNIIQITFDTDKSMAINVYPNPAAHYLKIESDDLMGEMIQIFSLNGQLVQEFQHTKSTTNLSVTDLPSGTYFIKMGSEVKKLTIQK